MAISFKDKIAYVNKFADKADEKLQKVIKLSVNIDSPKLNLTDAQKDKIKSSLQTAFDRIKKIEDEKTGAGKKPRQPNLMALTKQIQTKQGITFEQARTKAKQAFAAKKSGQTNAIQAVLQDFKSKVGKLAYSRATKGTDIKRDMERPALKEGKRKVTTQGYTTNKYGTFKNKVGSVYYENRANRIDINQPSKKRYPKLAKGGKMGYSRYNKGGMTMQAIANKYEKNEDENAHSENVVLLAKHFGTAEELKEAKAILKKHNEEGSLSSENGAKRRELSLRLIEKARAEMKKEGVQFAKGGRTATNYVGKKSKETWGKQDLSKMYDNNLDLIADVVDYIQDLRKDVGESYARDFVYELMEALKEGKITYNDGATLNFGEGGTLAKAERDAKRLSKTKGKMFVFKREEGEEKGNYIAVTDEDMFAELNSPYKSSFVSFFGNGKKYGDGGKITNQYEGKSASEVWNMLTKDQRQHFLYDHADEIQAYRGDEKGELRGTEIRNASKSDWADLDKDIKNRFENHVREGEYGGGGKFDGGGYVAVGEKDGYWTIISKPSTKENAQKMLDLGSLPRGESGKVVTVEEAKAHKKVIGREYLAYGGKLKYSRKK